MPVCDADTVVITYSTRRLCDVCVFVQIILYIMKFTTICVLVGICARLAAADPYDDIHGVNGKDTVVFLFNWKWPDIANECEQFLSKYGYAAVRVRCS